MGRPLCCFVVEPEHRACRQTCVYVVQVGNHTKTVCGTHRTRVNGEVIGRLGPARREAYGGRSAAGPLRMNGQDRNTKGHGNLMTSDLIVEAKEFNIPDEGLHQALVKKVEAGPPGQYGPTFRWTYEITTGDFAGEEIDELTGRDMTPNAKVSQRYTAATGEKVEPGVRYNLGTAVEKSVQIMVKHKESAKGGTWPQIGDVLAPARKKQRAVVVEEEDDEDDLAEA